MEALWKQHGQVLNVAEEQRVDQVRERIANVAFDLDQRFMESAHIAQLSHNGHW
jgi:hypothetical protein